ncbi:uncharacterized protein LOC122874668 [Siniperca chuatsi]|uniref:uncharacterized protein LOC122874668 n=1 Tax=Siniperca chuatsi TaxID=119488 RepID=UPI001CE19345|nr:uncharacterized protein LOC122874668 [Siniperca chuatsi]
MIDREVALEALCTLCNANVTSVQTQAVFPRAARGRGAPQQQLLIKNFITTILDADETCQVSRSNFVHLQSVLQGVDQAAGFARGNHVDIRTVTGRNHIIDENEFFDPRFDYDFTKLKDTETYYRGGEVYERPCGWQRFALKILDKYDGNTWLGTSYRSTQSVPGEWPVSYHGTSKMGADGIIDGYYKPGSGQVYGRGIYSTPYISEAIQYAKTFTSNKTGKKYQVILQNRINPTYRQKHNNDKYWLVPIPEETSTTEEQKMVERAIRPYGLLLKEV